MRKTNLDSLSFFKHIKRVSNSNSNTNSNTNSGTPLLTNQELAQRANDACGGVEELSMPLAPLAT